MNTRVLDTETVQIAGQNHSKLVWQIGWLDCDAKGITLDTHEYIVGDVYYRANSSDRFYKSYDEQIANNEIQVLSWAQIKKVFNETLNNNNIKAVAAYNALFDEQAIAQTTLVVSNGITDKFIEKNIQWRCIMRGAAQTFLHTNKYYNWAINNNETTKTGLPSITAQSAYRYISKNDKFIEDHTALSDVMIETQLMLTVQRYHKAIDWKPMRAFDARNKDCNKFYKSLMK